MVYPDSPTASSAVPSAVLYSPSSDDENQRNASYPVDAQWLRARLAQVLFQRSIGGDDQFLSRFAPPSSSPFLDESEEHLDELSSTTSPQHYDVRDEEPTSECPPSIEPQAASSPQLSSQSPPEPASVPHYQSSSHSQIPPGTGSTLPTMNTSGNFAHGHNDILQAIHYNFHDTRLLTASSDHHIKVWNRVGEKDWELVDTWRGHDAEIMDAKWTGPYMGEVLASIGEDNMFKVWEEDPTEVPNSGRRFKCIYAQQTKFRVPYVSMDIRSYLFETYVALITRDGHLTLLEPTTSDSLGDWRGVDQFFVRSRPDRGEETGFRVAFHHDPVPCYKAIEAGLDRNALSLAVAAMDVVKVYRATKAPGTDYQLQLAAVLPCHGTLIRDVAWAAGSYRGTDTIAAGCKDGFIRIFDVTTPVPSDAEKSTRAAASTTSDASSSTAGAAAAPSGIGAGLAGASRAEGAMPRREEHACTVRHAWREVACLDSQHGAVWRVKFTRNAGDTLASAGDDGVLRMWKRAITGEWMEFAEVDTAADDDQ